MEEPIKYFLIKIEGAINLVGYIPIATGVIGESCHDTKRCIENAIIDTGKSGFVEFSFESPLSDRSHLQSCHRKRYTVKLDRDLLLLSNISIETCEASKVSESSYDWKIEATSDDPATRKSGDSLYYDYTLRRVNNIIS